jgi:tetratricopeptide (TPR) repeat protein
MIHRLLVACALGMALGGAATASEPQRARAQALFEQGRRDFTEERYQAAYDAFHEAFGLTAAPALLYNMASALEALGRPGAAAQALRSYLRAVVEEPNRGALEARLRALDEAERLKEVERLRAARPHLIELDAVEARGRRRGLAIGLCTGVVVVVGVALGVGLALGLPAHVPDSTLGLHAATP